MKTLIVYRSSHGCTAKVAREIGSRLGSKVDYVELRDKHDPDLTSYRRIIVGGSIHAGMIQRRVKEFCIRNREDLLQKELGLFICCMYEGEMARKQFSDAYPEDLRQHAKSTLIAGGELDFGKLSFLERFAVRKAARVEESTSKIDEVAIERFARKMDRTFIPMMLFI
jgi:menaquinone-dependent protoporphyrinogen oxidase